LNLIIKNFVESIEALTIDAKKYYESPDNDRSSDRFQVIVGQVNPSFNKTKKLKQICMDILSIITTMNSDILSVQDFNLLKSYIKTRVENRQLGSPERSGGIIFASGTTDYNTLRISFSNEKMRNIACVSHELGHLIFFIKIPEERIKSLWGKDSIIQEDNDANKNWHKDNIAKNDSDLFTVMVHIEELIAHCFTLGILKACNFTKYSLFLEILEEVSDDPEHSVPKIALKNLLNTSHQMDDNIDWFGKAYNAINLYYSQPITSFDTFFKSLFI